MILLCNWERNLKLHLTLTQVNRLLLGVNLTSTCLMLMSLFYIDDENNDLMKIESWNTSEGNTKLTQYSLDKTKLTMVERCDVMIEELVGAENLSDAKRSYWFLNVRIRIESMLAYEVEI